MTQMFVMQTLFTLIFIYGLIKQQAMQKLTATDNTNIRYAFSLCFSTSLTIGTPFQDLNVWGTL